EGNPRGLAVRQNDRTRQQVDRARDRLLGEYEAAQADGVQFAPEGLEEAVGARGHRIRPHRFQIELVPGAQVTLVLGRPDLHAEPGGLAHRPSNPRVVAPSAKAKLFRVTGKLRY